MSDRPRSILVLTIGHSTHELPVFLQMLQDQGVTLVADVRTVPRSRHNPQFNRDTLPAALKAAGLGYVHLPGLGGLRHPRRDSPNPGWRNLSFRGFADYMLSPEFEDSLQGLIELAAAARLALMCAEALPWRCHRSLIADALTVRGLIVAHIMAGKTVQPHRLTPFARVAGTRITYPGDGEGNAAG